MQPFEDPKVELEQYTTRPHIASHRLNAIDNSYEGFVGTTVVDLGCGCGALGVGAAILGAHVLGIDIDEDALAIAQENREEMNPWEDEALSIDFVRANVLELSPGMRDRLKADVVIRTRPSAPGPRAWTWSSSGWPRHATSVCTLYGEP